MSIQEAEVWQFVQEMNRAWTVERNPQRLSSYFHPRMVAIAPDATERMEGQAACVAGWERFVSYAEIHQWTEREPSVQMYCAGLCAVVSYYYDLDCTIQGQRIFLKGRDMMTLVKEGSQWWLVADQFSPMPVK